MATEGYVYEEDTTGATMSISLKTGGASGKNILQKKQLKYIYYDMDTHGKDITLTVYIDDTAQSPTVTINTTSRAQKRIEDIPESWAGYIFDVRITGAGITDKDLEIYPPIALQYTLFGV